MNTKNFDIEIGFRERVKGFWGYRLTPDRGIPRRCRQSLSQISSDLNRKRGFRQGGEIQSIRPITIEVNRVIILMDLH